MIGNKKFEDPIKFVIVIRSLPIAWMGGYVVSYVEDKELRKAEVSAYGRFFTMTKPEKHLNFRRIFGGSGCPFLGPLIATSMISHNLLV